MPPSTPQPAAPISSCANPAHHSPGNSTTDSEPQLPDINYDHVVEIDTLDRSLIHALMIDGRAPFNRIAEILDVSDQTIARRYRKLRASGAARVVGHTYAYRVGQVRWYVR